MSNQIEPTSEFDTVRKVFVEDEESRYYVVVDVIENLRIRKIRPDIRRILNPECSDKRTGWVRKNFTISS